MIGSFADNVLPLIESTVDDTVEPEQPDDTGNDVTEDNDKTDDESDMTESGSDWNDDALTDLENIIEENTVKPTDTNEVAVNTVIDNEEDLGTDDDEYYYGNFKIHFASIPILLLSFVA